MKCQKCENKATFHITELTGGKLIELHLCEEHAREYLEEGDPEQVAATTLAGALAQQLAIGQAAEDLARADKRRCPICGISFYEFRNQGRLGCPHDYVCFEAELEPLLVNIHGEAIHVGKRPRRAPANVGRQMELIRLRREMKEAVAAEDYERASLLRDQIRMLEGST